MLWSKRRSSRSDPNTLRTHIQPQLSPRRPSSSANSTPRLPLAPLDPLDPQASQSLIVAAIDDMASYPSSSDNDSSAIKHHVARQNDCEVVDGKTNRYVTQFSFHR